MEKPTQCLTVEDVSARTTISVAGVWNLITAGTLKSHKIGRRRVVLEADLEAFLSELPE